MIHTLNITDIKKTKFNYLKSNNLLLKKPINFKKGLNIIIGENGSGKTTLIKMLTNYTFCWSGRTNLKLGIESKDSVHQLFNYQSSDFYSGIVVKNDYRLKVFKTIQNSDIKHHEQLNNIDFFERAFTKDNQSDGENQLYSISKTIKEMFSNSVATNFDVLNKDVNDTWKNYCNIIKQYIKDNNINETEDNYAITLMMDEPDRNLDVNNIKQIHTILSNPKDNGQIIVTLHNPLLIYSLLKIPNVNIIELSKGYKNKIIKTVNELL